MRRQVTFRTQARPPRVLMRVGLSAVVSWWRGRRPRASSAASAIQVALGAGLAWWAARVLLGVDALVYAPIGAIVATGVGEDRTARRPLRLVGGMGLAVVVAGVLVGFIGTGVWQMVLITLATTLTGRIFFVDPLARSYAAFHGAIVGAVGSTGLIPGRLKEAAIGAVVGFTVAHVVFPPRISQAALRPIERAGYVGRDALKHAAQACRDDGEDSIHLALWECRELEATLTAADGRWSFVRQLTTVSPMRWGKRPKAESLIETDDVMTRLLLEVPSVVRAVHRLLQRDRQPRAGLCEALEDLELSVAKMTRDVSRAAVDVRAVDEELGRIEDMLDHEAENSVVLTATAETIREFAEQVRHTASYLSEGRER